MKVKIEMELNDAMNIIKWFHNPPHLRNGTEEQKVKEALERMESQVDRIVENIDNCGDATFS